MSIQELSSLLLLLSVGAIVAAAVGAAFALGILRRAHAATQPEATFDVVVEETNVAHERNPLSQSNAGLNEP